jgi:hypothetical protein
MSGRAGGGKDKLVFPAQHVTFTLSSQYSCKANQTLSADDHAQQKSGETNFKNCS